MEKITSQRATESSQRKAQSRSDDLAFVKLVIEVERLTREVDFLAHLLYLPNGEQALMPRVSQLKEQLAQLIARQRWIQGIGGAIFVGIIIQIVQFFLKK